MGITHIGASEEDEVRTEIEPTESLICPDGRAALSKEPRKCNPGKGRPAPPNRAAEELTSRCSVRHTGVCRAAIVALGVIGDNVLCDNDSQLNVN